MKHIVFILAILKMITMTFSQENSDKILGTWFSPVKEGNILIYKIGDQYFGKLTYLKNALLDVNNPDITKRNLPLVGSIILKDFIYDEKKSFWKGKLYDYDGTSGNIYDSFITIKIDGTLNLKGFWGFSFFGLNRGLTLTKVLTD